MMKTDTDSGDLRILADATSAVEAAGRVLLARFSPANRVHDLPSLLAAIDANDIGLAVLPPLRELDEVAYLRFASVYQGFTSLDDFEAAITLLRVENSSPKGA